MGSVSQIIDSITASQGAEQTLISQLNNLSALPTTPANTTQINSIINQINALSAARVTLFSTLNSQATSLSAGVSNSRTDLVNQLTLLNVVEEQLTQATNNIDKIQNRNDSKKRMVEINTYYGQRYEAESNLMKMIILICAPLLILFILKKKNLLPPMISNYLIGITIAVGAIFVIRATWDISTRSNINFDEYDWNFEDPRSYNPTILEYNKEHLFNFDNPIKALVGNLGSCIGSGCCADGLFYDDVKKQCTKVRGNNTSTAVENFQCGGNLQGTNVANFNRDEEDKIGGISSFSYGSVGAPL